MSELRSAYEEAEARAVASAKAAAAQARRTMEAYDNLFAAARAVVEAWDLWSKIEVPTDAFGVRIDALRAAVEAVDS